jgi:hypothetical protein
MNFGNMALDGGNLIIASIEERRQLLKDSDHLVIY